jgi:hypothetical protein
VLLLIAMNNAASMCDTSKLFSVPCLSIILLI